MLAIEDRLALQDLIAAYSWALDTGDAEGLVACFTEDCVMSEECSRIQTCGKATKASAD